MSVRVTAIVISNDQPQRLRVALTALFAQKRPVDEIIAVDSSTGPEALAVFEEFKISPVIRRTDNSFGALVSAGAAQAASIFTTPNLAGDSLAPVQIVEDQKDLEGQHSWFWILHDDCAPEPDTLEKLLAAADLSPSVALLGPKQVDSEQPNLIVQQGLTLTKLGGIFSLVDNELDQAQHDSTDDVLAIGTAGALIRTDLYRRLQGFDRHAPNLASDIDFSIRARLSGYRVVVVPAAKLRHDTLSLKGQRPRKWLQGSPEQALRRAEIHLQLAYLPVLLVWMYAVLLPINGLLRALWRIASKQPAMVATEISSAFWGFATIPVRLLSRGKVELNQDISMRALWPLRATFAMARHRSRMLQDHVADDTTAAAKSRGLKNRETAQLEALPEATTKRFASAGGWFVFLGLAISSWQFWPSNSAAVGGALAPLNGDWLAVASRAGASWQNLGFGLAAPSDPFNWLLAGLGALWFVTPSLALAATLFLARPIAFSGAWFAFGLVSKKTWVRLLLAVAYSLWPAMIAAQQQGRLGAVVAWVLLPWFVYSGSKLLNSTVGRRARGRQTSWLGASALLFAAILVAAPSLALVLLIALLVAMAVNPKRILVLMWVPALGAALFAPYAWFMTAGLASPFALLSDPGLPVESAAQNFWQILLGLPNSQGSTLASLEPSAIFAAIFTALFSITALFAVVTRRALLASGFIVFAVIAASMGFIVQTSWFAPLEVHGSAASTGALVSLAFLLAAGLSLDALSSSLKRVSAAVGALGAAAALVCSLGAAGIASPISQPHSVAVSFADGRTVPAIVAAQATAGSALRTLQIAQTNDNNFSASLVAPGALGLEANSTAYRYVLALESARASGLLNIDSLVANLVSANGTDLKQSFEAANIGFVLVTDPNSSDLNASLNSVSELEPVGQTEFGWLWRVRDAKDSQPSVTGWRQNWSITKGIQLAFILIFVLLAIPGSPKRKARNTGSIFVANDFGDNEFSDGLDAGSGLSSGSDASSPVTLEDDEANEGERL